MDDYVSWLKPQDPIWKYQTTMMKDSSEYVVYISMGLTPASLEKFVGLAQARVSLKILQNQSISKGLKEDQTGGELYLPIFYFLINKIAYYMSIMETVRAAQVKQTPSLLY